MNNSPSNHSAIRFAAHLGSHALVLAAVLIGFGLTWFTNGNARITNLAGDHLASDVGGTTGADLLGQLSADPRSSETNKSASKFVQEPLTRSSFRPDYTSGLRRAHQRNNLTMLRAFSEAVVDARLSTVRLVNSVGDLIALGAVVDADGWIATKSSQLPPSSSVTVKLADNSEFLAEVVQRVSDVDIALLRINRSGLIPVAWGTSSIPSRGTWLATTDVDKMPSAVGVVSAGIQNVRSSRPVLGVELLDSVAGAEVLNVVYGTGADQAGLRRGDIITNVNGSKVSSHGEFQRAISPARGGDVVKLSVNRGDRLFETDAQLMDLSVELLDETEMEVNGPISARASGFNRVFLHDTVLEPNQCGGPLCNLDGKVVGLNIARAGRVSSYALPVDVVRPLLEGMIAQAKLVSRPVNPAPATQVR